MRRYRLVDCETITKLYDLKFDDFDRVEDEELDDVLVEDHRGREMSFWDFFSEDIVLGAKKYGDEIHAYVLVKPRIGFVSELLVCRLKRK